MKAKPAKHLIVRAVLEFVDLFYAVSCDAWIFRKRGFCWYMTSWFKQDELGKLSYQFVYPLLDLIRETAVNAADRDRRQENSEQIFSERMFSALICLSFLPWSILNLKEKSGSVILAELNSFPSHVLNNHTGLEDSSFNKYTCGYAGKHSSKEILRIGMFRTPEPLINRSKIFKNKITLLWVLMTF